MCKLVPALLGAALTVLAALPADAGLLTSATWETGWTVTRSLDPVAFAVPVSASGTSTSTSIAVNLVVPPFLGSKPVSLPTLISPIARLSLGGSQAIAATSGGMVTAAPGITGNATTAVATVGMAGTITVLSVPLNVGASGTFITTHRNVLGINQTLTIVFYEWTVGTRTFSGLTTSGASLPNATAMGSFDLTSGGGGMARLVAPARIHVQSQVPTRTFVSLTTLTLNFVPEPGSLSLLGAAAVALGLWTRRRR